MCKIQCCYLSSGKSGPKQIQIHSDQRDLFGDDFQERGVGQSKLHKCVDAGGSFTRNDDLLTFSNDTAEHREESGTLWVRMLSE